MGGVGIPMIVVIGLGLIPFIKREEAETGAWFGGPGGLRLVARSAVFGLASVLGIEAFAIRFGWLREWFPEIPQLVITAVNPGTLLAAIYAAYSLWIVRRYGSARAGALALFTCFLCGFVVLRSSARIPGPLDLLLVAGRLAQALTPMNKNKHLLLWSSLGALCLLVGAAVQENFLKEWRGIQASIQTDAGPADVRLRQIVAPKLGVTDRCVTCHVGMAPGEQEGSGHPLAAAHGPVGHDPAEFGCTVCHGGQGRATEKADAHGDVRFWPAPMIPTRYAYAGCGSCHTHIRVPGQSELERGRSLLERYDCLACHRVDCRGGTLRPGGVGGMEGPDLSQAGARGFDTRWNEKHLQFAGQPDKAGWQDAFTDID